MKNLFNLENPVWIFMGKLMDMLVLTVLWAVASLPVVTIGASTAALYYVTLKLAKNEEGYIARSFFRAFKENLRQGIAAGILVLAAGVFLACDLYVYYYSEGSFGIVMLWASILLTALYLMIVLHLFPLMARCRTDLKYLFVMAFMISVKNFGWTLLMFVSVACLLAVSIFVMAPLLAISVGGIAYIHSKILNMLWKEYHLELA